MTNREYLRLVAVEVKNGQLLGYLETDPDTPIVLSFLRQSGPDLIANTPNSGAAKLPETKSLVGLEYDLTQSLSQTGNLPARGGQVGSWHKATRRKQRKDRR